MMQMQMQNQMTKMKIGTALIEAVDSQPYRCKAIAQAVVRCPRETTPAL